MYCRRFNCIGFQCDSGTKVETDLFALFEKEVIRKKGSHIDKKEMKAHLMTRFRDHFRSDKCKGGGHKQITHCGLPFCLVVRIQHKYGQTCSTCEKAPCAFYQHFGDAFPDCMALMDTSKRPAWEVRRFLYADYTEELNLDTNGSDRIHCGHDSDGDSVFAEEDAGVHYHQVDKSLVPSCIARLINVAFP